MTSLGRQTTILLSLKHCWMIPPNDHCILAVITFFPNITALAFLVFSRLFSSFLVCFYLSSCSLQVEVSSWLLLRRGSFSRRCISLYPPNISVVIFSLWEGRGPRAEGRGPRAEGRGPRAAGTTVSRCVALSRDR